MHKRTLYIVLGGLFLIGLAAFAGVVYYEKIYLPAIHQAQMNTYIQNSKQATQSFYSGDYTNSINQLQALLKTAPNKSEEGRLRVLIASSIKGRNGDGDLATSIQMYKDIINDYTIPPVWRAISLNSLAAIVTANTTAFYGLYFAESPYNTYMPTSGTESSRVQIAYFNILKASDNTYPTSLAEYTIAGNYFLPLLLNSPASQSEKTTMAHTMQTYIDEGDSRNDSGLYSPATTVTLLFFRARAINGIGKILNTPDLATREAALKLVLTTANQLGQDVSGKSAYSTVLFDRFTYANFLRESAPGRVSDIQELLAPFANASGNDIPAFFKVLPSRPSTDYVKTSAIALGKISPDFEKFIQSIGVETK